MRTQQVIDVERDASSSSVQLVLRETAEGVSVDDVVSKTDAELVVRRDAVKQMQQ